MEKLFKLKEFVISELQDCRVIFSQIINRYDDGKAQLTVKNTNVNMAKNNLESIDNSNISCEDVGKQGLHLNPHGTGKLAVNIIKTLKRL